MKLIINSIEKDVSSHNVLSLLEELNLKASLVAVEKNKTIIPKDKYSATPLKDGDVIEIIRFMGGGL